MKKLLILLMMVILAISVAAEKQTITIGKYTVEGEDLVSFSNENREVASIKLSLEEWATITWKPDPKEDKFCLNDCSLKEEKECTCKLFMYGLSCILTTDGTCEGVADGEVDISVRFNDIEETEKKYDFSSFTKLNYDIVTREFTIKSKEFEYLGRTITSEKPIKLYGDMVLGDFKISNEQGLLQVTSQKGTLAETHILPDRILASKNTNVRYEPPILFEFDGEIQDVGIQFEGRKDSYEICLNEENCNAIGSHVIIDEFKQLFYAEGKSDGGPKILFGSGSRFLRSNSADTKFEVNNLEDSFLKITLDDVIPEIDIKVSSDKKSNNLNPPVSFINGNSNFLLYSDGLFTNSTKGEGAESAVVTLMLTDKDDKPIIKEYSKPAKIVFSNENQFKIVSSTEDSVVTYSRILAESPIFKKIPKLQSINGFSVDETKLLINYFENLPNTLTSNLKNINLLSPEQISKVCESQTTRQLIFTIAGCADALGNINLNKDIFNNNIIAHELTHIYLREVQSKNPETVNLRAELSQAQIDLYNLQLTEGIGYGAGASHEYEELSSKIEKLDAEYTEKIADESIIKKWLATNTADVMKSGCKLDYCRDRITTTPKGRVVWADTKTTEPRYGVVSPYSCMNCEEDLAEFVQYSNLNPDGIMIAVKCPPPNTYAKKAELLREYGLIDTIKYNIMVPKEIRECIRGGA
ncbi:MAG: hypothetical protein ABIH53_03750 [archaeon]